MTPIAPAGSAARRCGRSVKRAESTSSRPQPKANPIRTAPVISGADPAGDRAGDARGEHSAGSDAATIIARPR
jgi:hypothetical protein